MAINRPTNLNIRDVPGNGSIIGPSTSPSCVESTTVCESCYNTCSACTLSFDSGVLGSQNTFCVCPCCDIVCDCDCIVCNRTIPSGMWKTSEQYEAKERDAWGDSTSSSGPETCLCNINSGVTCKSACNVDVGGYIIRVDSNTAWIASPTEVQVNWANRNNAVTTANADAACGDWFVPSIGQLQNPGLACRTYWNAPGSRTWSNSQYHSNRAWLVAFHNDRTICQGTGTAYRTRAFRTVSF